MESPFDCVQNDVLALASLYLAMQKFLPLLDQHLRAALPAAEQVLAGSPLFVLFGGCFDKLSMTKHYTQNGIKEIHSTPLSLRSV